MPLTSLQPFSIDSTQTYYFNNISVAQNIYQNNTLLSNTILERHYKNIGTLSTNVGTDKWYVPVNSKITSIRSRVEVAPQGNTPLTVAVKINSVSTATLSINSGTTVSSLNTSTINVNTNDYITVDVINIGSTVAGSDLTVTFTYTRTT